MKKEEKFMLEAIAEMRRGLKAGQSPFGAIVVDARGKTIAKGHNTVVKDNDPSAHAEVNAIRNACKKLKTFKLTGCTVYTSCEACPMCFSAIHWAECKEVVFGALIEDAAFLGFHELYISDKFMQSHGKSKVKVTGPILRKECAAAMREWLNNTKRKVY